MCTWSERATCRRETAALRGLWTGDWTVASELNALLLKFGPRNVTAVTSNGLLRVLPHAEPLSPVESVLELTAAILGAPHPEVTRKAETHLAGETARKVIWLTTGLDAGDGTFTVVSSLRSAVGLYRARTSGREVSSGQVTQQGADAVLKAIGIGYLLNLCLPDSEDALVDLVRLPAGRALLSYYAAADVALPFVGQRADEERFLSDLLAEHAEAQARKIATVAGTQAVQAARAHLPAIALTIDVLVRCSEESLEPLSRAAEGAIPGADRTVDTVGDQMASGEDGLSVYRFLGLRVVAEAAVVRAAQELGVAVPDTSAAWVARFVDAPRHTGQPPALEPQPKPSSGALAAMLDATRTEPSTALSGAEPSTGESEEDAFEDIPTDEYARPELPASEEPGASDQVAADGAPPTETVAPPPRTPPISKRSPAAQPTASPSPGPASVRTPPDKTDGGASVPKARMVAPPPTVEHPMPQSSSSKPGADVPDANKSGLSFTAIGIALAIVCLIGCGGILTLAGVGAVFMGAHEETSEESPSDASKGDQNGAKRGSKKGGKSGGKSGGKPKKRGGR